MILHIPHSSTEVPPEVRRTLALTDEEVARELLRMTDAWTGELFPATAGVGCEAVVFPVSRLVVDPERFEHDGQELMSLKGMGAVYLMTADGTQLRKDLPDEDRATLIERYYRPHHDKLERAVDRELTKTGRALIVDCHSFPAKPLPYETDQTRLRPQICIGTDGFHTTERLSAAAVKGFRDRGYWVELNTPFSGSIVPVRWYRSEPLVQSIMVEVRRDLYMDEATGKRRPGFDAVRNDVRVVLDALGNVVLEGLRR